MRRFLYSKPDCSIESAHWLMCLFCTSPESGGLEEVEYEDLVI